MKEFIYEKLVRDKIPEIIEKSGKQCKTEILSDEKYLEMIDKKLDEELAEYHKDKISRSLRICWKLFMRQRKLVDILSKI